MVVERRAVLLALLVAAAFAYVTAQNASGSDPTQAAKPGQAVSTASSTDKAQVASVATAGVHAAKAKAVHVTAKAKTPAITRQALQPKAAKQQRSKAAYYDDDSDSADDGSDANEDKLFVEEKDDSDSKFVSMVANEQLKPL